MSQIAKSVTDRKLWRLTKNPGQGLSTWIYSESQQFFGEAWLCKHFLSNLRIILQSWAYRYSDREICRTCPAGSWNLIAGHFVQQSPNTYKKEVKENKNNHWRSLIINLENVWQGLKMSGREPKARGTFRTTCQKYFSWSLPVKVRSNFWQHSYVWTICLSFRRFVGHSLKHFSNEHMIFTGHVHVSYI